MASPDNPADQGSTKDTQVTKSVFRDGRFWNPWDTWDEKESMMSSGFKMLMTEKNNSNIPSQAVSNAIYI